MTPLPTYPSPPTSPLEVLVRVDELLCDESRWCKNHFAIDENSEIVDIHSPDATCFCVSGATCRVGDGGLDGAADKVLRKVIGGLISIFNDAPETTFAMVKAVLAGAIEMAKAQSESGSQV